MQYEIYKQVFLSNLKDRSRNVDNDPGHITSSIKATKAVVKSLYMSGRLGRIQHQECRRCRTQSRWTTT